MKHITISGLPLKYTMIFVADFRQTQQMVMHTITANHCVNTLLVVTKCVVTIKLVINSIAIYN